MPLDQDLVKKYLATRNELKKRFLQERVQKQEMTRGFEKQFAPLLEPTRETAKETKEVKEARTDLPEGIARGTREAMADLPQEIARALPQPLPEYQSQLKTRPQFFNEEGRQRIFDDPSEFASKAPDNWRDLLLNPPEKNPTVNNWRKWVFRELTGKKQVKVDDKDWERFNQQLLEMYGYGIKYYKNPEELLDRLEMLTTSYRAGNTSRELKNEASNILDHLLKDDDIDEELYKELWAVFN